MRIWKSGFRHFGLIVIGIVVFMGAVGAYAADTLNPGDTLRIGDSLTSANREYRLILQRDGNLVLYTARRQPLWTSNTAGKPVEKCIMQGDGNLVLYLANGQAVWSTDTAGKPGSFLLVQNDGNLVIYHPQAVWVSNTQREFRDGPRGRDEGRDRWDREREDRDQWHDRGR